MQLLCIKVLEYTCIASEYMQLIFSFMYELALCFTIWKWLLILENKTVKILKIVNLQKIMYLENLYVLWYS